MKVYEVIFNWSTEDDNCIETAIFSTYEKAKEYFDNIIENENDAEVSWVGDGVFDENGEVNEGYELNCSPDYPENEEHDLRRQIYKFAFRTIKRYSAFKRFPNNRPQRTFHNRRQPSRRFGQVRT